jgi:hypothetical protein
MTPAQRARDALRRMDEARGFSAGLADGYARGLTDGRGQYRREWLWRGVSFALGVLALEAWRWWT